MKANEPGRSKFGQGKQSWHRHQSQAIGTLAKPQLLKVITIKHLKVAERPLQGDTMLRLFYSVASCLHLTLTNC